MRQVVHDEFARNGSQGVDRAIAHLLYGAGDPYARVDDATSQTVASLTRDQACAFMAAHYAPSTTTITISGPIDPRNVEHMLEGGLGRVAARDVAPRVPRSTVAERAFRTHLKAPVGTPSLAIVWPVADDHATRTITAFAIHTMADQLGATAFGDQHHLGLWFERLPDGADARIAQVRKLLDRPIVRDYGFARERTKLLTEELETLDEVVWRDANLADGIKLDSTLQAIAKLTPRRVESLIEDTLAWSRARVIELDPDGSRASWSPTELGQPAHTLRETSNVPDMQDVPVAAPEIGVLARARTFALPDGLTVVLAPTSPVPLVHARLVFPAGNAAEPSHPGTASVAIAALGEAAARNNIRNNWASVARWRAGLDSASLDVRGPFMYADLVFARFAGLAHDRVTRDDIAHGFDWMKRVASAPAHSSWDIDADLRAAVYGANHPYGLAQYPDVLDIQHFDPNAAEQFYARYLQPSRATLIVTGGFDPDVVARIVERVFAGWNGTAQAVAPIATQGEGGRFASEHAGNVVSLQIQWPGPMLDDRFAAREVLGEMIMSVAPQFYSKWEQLAQGGRYVLYGVIPADTAPQQIADISRKLDAIGSGSDADRAAFIAARRHGARWRIGGSLTAAQWTDSIWFALGNGRDLAWLRGLPAAKGRVTYDDVAALAKSELAPARATWHVAGPREVVTAVYQTLGVEPKWFER